MITQCPACQCEVLEAETSQGDKLLLDLQVPIYLGLTGYDHESVNHSMGEYVRGQAHTNGIESFWALLKRGYYGVFHHFTWKHLPRYLSEFETRWNMSGLPQEERLDAMLESVVGRRLTYERLIS